MIKKISLSSLAILGLSSIFFACEDSSILDVNTENIDKIPEVAVVSVETKSSVAEVGELSSEEGTSVDAGSSEGTSITLGSSAGNSQIGTSSEDIFKSSEGTSSTEVIISSTEIELSSSVDAGSSTPLSSIDAGSSAGMSSQGATSCDGLAQWDSVAWNLTGGGVKFLNDDKSSAWTCDGTAFCGYGPGDAQSLWVKEFDC